MPSSDKPDRLHPHESQAAPRRDRLPLFDEAELAPARRLRRAADRAPELRLLRATTRAANTCATAASRVWRQRRPPVVHAAALHAARADGLPRPRGRHRSRRLRRRRRDGAARAGHAGQGHVLPAALRGEEARGCACDQRDAARLRKADALALPRAIRFAVPAKARLLRLDRPQARGPEHDRAVRERVERLRQADTRRRS